MKLFVVVDVDIAAFLWRAYWQPVRAMYDIVVAAVGIRQTIDEDPYCNLFGI